MDYVLSEHAKDMLKERGISEEWVRRTVNSPELEETGKDNNVHYYKSIPEYGERMLHVVVNPNVIPKRILTTFFDRRARRGK